VELLTKTNIDFIGKRYFFFGVTGILILMGIVSLIVRGGPNYGIDFTGGLLLQVGFNRPMDMVGFRSTLDAAGITGCELQSSGDSVIVRIKQKDLNADAFASKVMQAMNQKYSDLKPIVERKEFVGPAVGKHLRQQALLAITFSLLGIIVYVAFRFNSGVWGVAGVFALFHDVFIVFGLFSVFNKEVTLTVITALLTLAGYSMNDTIVVYDRIRDNLKLYNKKTLYEILNDSINQTLSRTVITSVTVFIVVLGLFLFGGEVIHDFSFALLMGVVVGTYSSIYVASPMIYEWEEYKKRRAAKFMPVRKR
jgi:preprotein translocase subunit SecF